VEVQAVYAQMNNSY